MRCVSKRFRLLLACVMASASSTLMAQTATDVPSVFSPGVISGAAGVQSATFSPDGNTVYFTRRNAAQSAIMESHRHGSVWWTPRIASFSGQWRDIEPSMAPDGSFLVFASSRPIDGGTRPLDGEWGGKTWPGRGGHLWKVTRTRDGNWSSPQLLPDTVNTSNATFTPSVAADGSLYFMRAEPSGKFRLYVSTFSHGHYAQATPLPFSDGSSDDSDLAIAPDQSFAVYGSDREHANHNDLFIVFRNAGSWGKPLNLGAAINGEGGAFNNSEARLGADHVTLYYSNTQVMPVSFPRTSAQAQTDVARLSAWDNGSSHIWMVSLRR
jgi:hypothetical protein